MAAVSLDIPNAKVDRVCAAIAVQMRVSAAELATYTSAQKLAMVKAFYKQVTLDAVRSYELPTAESAARTTRNADIDTNVGNVIT